MPLKSASRDLFANVELATLEERQTQKIQVSSVSRPEMLSQNEPEVTKPKRKLWRTRLRWPRNLNPVAPPIPIDEVLSSKPMEDELSHWGEYGLLEDFVTVLHRDGTPTYRRRWVMILHGVKQIENWERFQYRFDRRSWKFTIPRARIILPSGKQRFATITNRSCDRFGYSRQLDVSFTQLAPGVVVEIEDQQDNFIPYQDCPGTWGEFALQTPHPCKRRRITLAVAQPFEARFELHNDAPAPTERQAGDYRVWSWDQVDIPGIESDQVTPPLLEFAPWIDFTTLSSWKPIAKYYFNQLKLPTHHQLEKLAKTLSAKGEGEDDKIAAAYNYAARDVRYGRPKENSTDWAIRPLGAIAEELRGDCKDKAALLVALLSEFDIEARVVLVRSAQSGRVSLLPGTRFNHALVLAKADGKELWLDPAGHAYSFGQLPSFDQGIQGLILDRQEPQTAWIPAAKPADHCLERIVRGRLEPDGSYRADIRLLARGDRAASWRSGLIERNAATRERVLRQYIGGSIPSAEITNFSVEHLDDLNGDLVISHSAVMSRLARRIQKLMLLRIPWLEPIRENGFFAAISRPQPLLVPIHSISDRLNIELPTAFTGYGLPWKRIEESDWGRYQCHVRIENGALQCERDFELRGGIVLSEQYRQIRRFTDACIDNDASDIVLIGGDIT
ncbi:MAG TPA: DUF3857 domain-containing protein [Gemmataceae bacterium]|nr:DUF3857 domain-containing protein [Gemmataceae bacterium]